MRVTVINKSDSEHPVNAFIRAADSAPHHDTCGAGTIKVEMTGRFQSTCPLVTVSYSL